MQESEYGVLDSDRLIFFFQAEDGIRDLVRSRGLGDVYKRQEGACPECKGAGVLYSDLGVMAGVATTCEPVSYTHLTLPTSDLV